MEEAYRVIWYKIMNAVFYLRPFLVSFSVAVFLLLVLRIVMAKYAATGARDFSFLRRFGGAAIIAASLSAVLLDGRLVLSPVIVGMLFGSVLIFLFGVWDDIVKLSWKGQLAFQGALGVLLFAFGMRIFSLPVPFLGQVFTDTLPGGAVLGFVVLVLWIVLVMNVMNWADGVDGLLSAVSLVSFGVIFLLSARPEVHQPPVGILSMAFFGAVLGFFLFNMPPARVLAGTSGSFFVGFALASLSVLSGTKMATALLALSLPLIDALWVFSERLLSGVSPFCGGDFRHLHYRLREIGWSDRRIVLCYAIFSGLLGALALSMNAFGKTISFISVCALVLLFLLWVKRKTFFLQQKRV